ncbi:MAG: gamma-glutamyl-gamma-aminobutyrate hydrolase family protein [Candidatus Zixiibacteriota bacterium]
MNEPIIGVVLAQTPEDHQFKVLPAYRFEFLKQHYYEAVEAAGAVAIAIPLTERHEHIHRYVSIVDGLFIVGGDDVHPELYGEPIDPLCHPQMPRRDNFEVALIKATFAARKPILGICRGLQIMNVAFGGSLYQDLSYQSGAGNHSQQGELDFATRHRVNVVPNSLLSRLTGESAFETNTAHHQGIKRVGNGIKIAATAEDGVIEAIEADGFTLGVQWHPEAWGQDKVSRSIFSAFVQTAGAGN